MHSLKSFLTLCLTFATVILHAEERESVAEFLRDNLPRYATMYRELHASPELSFEEKETSQKMAAQLRELGFDVTERIGGYGVVGVLKNGAGPTLLLRSDLDALPVVEETGLPYASQVRTVTPRGETVGVMHACGHDMHMTMLMAALDYLAHHRDKWQGTLIAVFQPAEELGAGAKAMIADGLLTKFGRPDYAIALHVSADKEVGKVFLRGGFVFANVDSVDITIHGRGGHGAFPHMTCDPIVIAAKLIVDLQTIASRETKPTDPVVVTVGAIQGGTKHNIIPDDCKLQLTVRSYGEKSREQVLSAIKRKADAAAASANAPAPTVEFSEGTPALFNDPELVTRIQGVLSKTLGVENVIESEPTMGGEDFGRIGGAGVPIVMISVGTLEPERLKAYQEAGEIPSLHSAKFYPQIESTITTGTNVLTAAALDLLGKD
jgi:hippurate hydrolase